MAHYEIIDDDVGDAGLFVVLYIMSIIWRTYISTAVPQPNPVEGAGTGPMSGAGHMRGYVVYVYFPRSIYKCLWSPNIFSSLFRLNEGHKIYETNRGRENLARSAKLKIQTNEGQQLIIPPELYRSFQRCPPPDLHQQCLNLIRLRALEQALCGFNTPMAMGC